MPKLSVITITYKDPSGLEKTALSLEKLVEKVDFEWIVVDSSPELNQAFLEKTNLPLKHLVRAAKGIYPAMNDGCKAATGDFLWFLNGGDEATAEVTTHLLSIPSSKEIFVAAVELWEKDHFLRKQNPGNLDYALRGVNGICHQGIIFPKIACQHLFREDFRLISDYLHLLECQKLGFIFQASPHCIARFHKGGASDSVVPALQEFWRAQLTNAANHSLRQRTSHLMALVWKTNVILLKRTLSKFRIFQSLRKKS